MSKKHDFFESWGQAFRSSGISMVVLVFKNWFKITVALIGLLELLYFPYLSTFSLFSKLQMFTQKLSEGSLPTILGDYFTISLPLTFLVIKKLYDYLQEEDPLYLKTKNISFFRREFSPLTYLICAAFNTRPVILWKGWLPCIVGDEYYTVTVLTEKPLTTYIRKFISLLVMDMILFFGTCVVSTNNLPIAISVYLTVMCVCMILKVYWGIKALHEIEKITSDPIETLEDLKDSVFVNIPTVGANWGGLGPHENLEYYTIMAWNIKATFLVDRFLIKINSAQELVSILNKYWELRNEIFRHAIVTTNGSLNDIKDALVSKEGTREAIESLNKSIQKCIKKFGKENVLDVLDYSPIDSFMSAIKRFPSQDKDQSLIAYLEESSFYFFEVEQSLAMELINRESVISALDTAITQQCALGNTLRKECLVFWKNYFL